MSDVNSRRKIIGERLKSLRKKSGLYQADLAKKIGENPSYISRWENGGMDIDVPQLYKFADFFGVPVTYILGEDYTNKDGIGKIIKARRDLKNISFYELSKKLNGKIEPLRLKEIEDGITYPTDSELQDLAMLLEIDLNNLKSDVESHIEVIRKELHLLGFDVPDIEAIIQHIQFKIEK